MKTAIRYYTKSKKGNTKKIADFVSNEISVSAFDVSIDLEEEVEKLLLINAMYAADIDNEIKLFLERNAGKIKEVININSAATGKSTYKQVKKVCDKLNIKLSDKEFHTVASWIFINKGRPNEDDFNRLKDFLRGLDING